MLTTDSRLESGGDNEVAVAVKLCHNLGGFGMTLEARRDHLDGPDMLGIS